MGTPKDPAVAMLTAVVEEAERAGVTRSAVAAAIGVKLPLFCHWLASRARPGAVYREGIEIATGGAVPADMWKTPEDRKYLANVTRISAIPPRPTSPNPRASRAHGHRQARTRRQQTAKGGGR